MIFFVYILPPHVGSLSCVQNLMSLDLQYLNACRAETVLRFTFWTWWETSRSTGERLGGSSELVSGAWPEGPLVIKPQLSVLVEPQTLWEKKLPLSLARRPTQGHYSREIRGYASTPRQRQQLRPALVTIQDPTLLIASRKGWKQWRDIPDVVAPVLREHVGPGICHTPVSQLVCPTIGLTFTLRRLQRFPIGQGDGCNHTPGLYYYTLQDSCVEISFLQSWNLSVRILGGQSNKYISLIFIARQSFRECAVYCDTSSIVF